MSMIAEVHGSHNVGAVASLVSGLRGVIAKRSLYKRTERELQSLTTMELQDLGLSRSMIRSVAFEAAYGK